MWRTELVCRRDSGKTEWYPENGSFRDSELLVSRGISRPGTSRASRIASMERVRRFFDSILPVTKQTSRFADVANRRLVFSINSGRSGSQFLAEVLSTAKEVCGYHEPEPKMNREYLEMINRLPYQATRTARVIKCQAIADVLRQMEPGQVYAETTQMFIKTFHDVVLEEFHNVEVVLLRRDLAHVLRSFVEMGYFSNRNAYWDKWMSSPAAATAALRPRREYSTLDQFDRCIAYLLDIEARGARFRREYRHVPVHEVQLDSLDQYSAVEELFAALRISTTSKTEGACRQRINERNAVKQQINNPTTLETCHARLERYLKEVQQEPAGWLLGRVTTPPG